MPVSNSSRLLRPISGAAKLLVFLTTIAAFVSLLALRIEKLISQPYPNTTDGYYYLHELRSYLATGRGYYTDHSPFFLLSTSMGRLFGIGDEQTLLDATAFTSLTILGLALALPLARRRLWWLLPAMFLLPWGSDVLYFRNYSFPRQALALALVMLGLSLSLPSQRKASRSLSSIVGATFLLVGAAMHSLAALVGIALVLSELRIRASSRLLIGLVAAGALLWYATAQEKELLGGMPPGIHFGWQAACIYLRCTSSERVEFFLQALSFLLFVIYLAHKPSEERTPAPPAIFGIVLLYVLFNCAVWDFRGGMAFRLATSSTWIIFFGWSLLLGHKDSPRYLPILFVIALSAGTAAWLKFEHNPYSRKRPWIEILAAHKQILTDWIPNDALVIAPHGSEFAVTYFLGKRATHDLSPRSGIPLFKLTRASLVARECISVESISGSTSFAASCINFGHDRAIYRVEDGENLSDNFSWKPE